MFLVQSASERIASPKQADTVRPAQQRPLTGETLQEPVRYQPRDHQKPAHDHTQSRPHDHAHHSRSRHSPDQVPRQYDQQLSNYEYSRELRKVGNSPLNQLERQISIARTKSSSARSTPSSLSPNSTVASGPSSSSRKSPAQNTLKESLIRKDTVHTAATESTHDSFYTTETSPESPRSTDRSSLDNSPIKFSPVNSASSSHHTDTSSTPSSPTRSCSRSVVDTPTRVDTPVSADPIKEDTTTVVDTPTEVDTTTEVDTSTVDGPTQVESTKADSPKQAAAASPKVTEKVPTPTAQSSIPTSRSIGNLVSAASIKPISRSISAILRSNSLISKSKPSAAGSSIKRSNTFVVDSTSVRLNNPTVESTLTRLDTADSTPRRYNNIIIDSTPVTLSNADSTPAPLINSDSPHTRLINPESTPLNRIPRSNSTSQVSKHTNLIKRSNTIATLDRTLKAPEFPDSLHNSLDPSAIRKSIKLAKLPLNLKLKDLPSLPERLEEQYEKSQKLQESANLAYQQTEFIIIESDPESSPSKTQESPETDLKKDTTEPYVSKISHPATQLLRNSSKSPGKMESPSKKSRLDEDNDSIYSFDSVSTNGRLLDRLDLDDFDEYNNQRYSMLSMQTNDRLLDRLDFEQDTIMEEDSTDKEEEEEEVKLPANVSRGIPAPIFDSRPNLSNILPQRNGSLQNNRQAHDALLRHVQKNIVFKNTAIGVESARSDVPILNRANTFNPRQPQMQSQQQQVQLNMLPMRGNSQIALQSDRPVQPNRSTSAPILGATDPLQRRVTSDSQVQQQLISHQQSQQPMPDISNESRISLALQLRAMGKVREASYQLQVLANIPNNYPRAMYLYAIALRAGDGVKQNDQSAIKWLCKCILINVHLASNKEQPGNEKTTKLIEKLNELHPSALIKLILKQLTYTAERDPLKHGSEPFMCHMYFSGLSKLEINRLLHIFKNKLDIISLSYNELGKMLFKGQGTGARDELNGIKLLSMAGSLGNVDAMIELGEIWTTKSKHYKKDFAKASAWLKSSELFGFKSIGNSWIYKEKYNKK